MISLVDHRARVLADATAVEPLEMLVADSLGCVIAADVSAVVPVPAAPCAAFEGIAVRSCDVREAGAAPAALVALRWASGAVAEGTAAYIHAGEPIPEGADAVLPTGTWRDDSRLFEGADAPVVIEAPAHAGYGVWPIGHDCEPGETAVPAGTVVGPGTIALLVAAGVTRVSVIPKPRCVVMSIADEPGSDPVLGMLAAVVSAAGGQAYTVGPVLADLQLRDVIEDQLVRADLIVLCGAWSPAAESAVGSHLAELGELSKVEVEMEPAGRTWLATIGPSRTPVLVVPADPWAAYVSFDAFVGPLVRALRGEDPLSRPAVTAECTADVPAVADRHRYILGMLSQSGDESRVQPLHPSRAGLLNAANCVIVLEPHGQLRAGQPSTVFPFALAASGLR